jgi:hypothetical protein
MVLINMGGRRSTYKKRAQRRGGSHSRRATKEVDLSVVSSSHPEVIAIVDRIKLRYDYKHPQITKSIIDYCVQKVNSKTAEEYRNIASEPESTCSYLLQTKYNEDIKLLLHIFEALLEAATSYMVNFTKKSRVTTEFVDKGIQHDDWFLKILFA